MTFHNPDIGRNNPLTKSMYVQKVQQEIVDPGSQKFLITEDGKYITTEDGRFIVTEN